MSSQYDSGACDRKELVALYALGALSVDESSAVEAHITNCAGCRQELETQRETVDSFVSWPIDMLRPSAPLWERLSNRIAEETGGTPLPRAPRRWPEPEWEEVAPGISCKILATDREHHRVSMLVRLGPGVDYPPHRHAGVEELHLLAGDLLVNDKKLHPGDYIRAQAGSADARVWSETGCTCVLITSTLDELR